MSSTNEWRRELERSPIRRPFTLDFMEIFRCCSSLSLSLVGRGKINLTLADMRHVAPLATETMFNGFKIVNFIYHSYSHSLACACLAPKSELCCCSVVTMGEAGNSLLNSVILVKFDRFKASSRPERSEKIESQLELGPLRLKVWFHQCLFFFICCVNCYFIRFRLGQKTENNRSMVNFLLLSFLSRI